VTGECAFGAEPPGVGCFTDDLRRGQRPTAHDGQQGRGNRGDPLGDLGGEFVDLDSEQTQVLHQPQRQSKDDGAVGVT
jgi:hypothetical protein